MKTDLKLAWRALSRRPGFTAAVLVTLALGLGGGVAIYSLVDAVLLDPLPFSDPASLVEVWETVQRDATEERPFSYPDFLDLRQEVPSLGEAAAISRRSFVLRGQGAPRWIDGALVSPELFSLLGVAPQRGGLLSSGDTAQVVLSHSLWSGLFGGDPAVLGRTLSLDGESFVVVGVTPAGFSGVRGDEDLWVSIEGASPDRLADRQSRWHRTVARLAPGRTVEQARAELHTLFARLAQEHDQRGYGADLGDLRERLFGDLRRPVVTLLAAVAVLLLVVCTNVANLMIVRAFGQRSELALCAALGATRGRLLRRSVVESLLLGLAGGGAGVLIARWATPLLLRNSPIDLPGFATVGLNLRVMGVAIALAAGVGLLLALANAGALRSTPLGTLVRSESRSSAPRGPRRALLIAEVALSALLAVGAGLLVRSWRQIHLIDPGFDGRSAVFFRVDLPADDSADSLARTSLLRDQLLAGLRTVPGVDAVAAGSDTPLEDGYSATVVSREGAELDPQAPYGGAIRTYRHTVSERYFEALGVRIVAGRGFEPTDDATSPRVAVLSVALADRLWPEGDAVGRRFRVGPPDAPGASAEENPGAWFTVVGVADDLRFRALVPGPGAPPPDPDAYFAARQVRLASLSVVARTLPPPSSMLQPLLARTQEALPDAAVREAETTATRIGRQIARFRFSTLLVLLFAGLSVALAGLGVYAVMAYFVTERQREIGVRMAVGADRGRVVREVMGEAAAIGGIGLLLGLLTAAALSSRLSGLLVGVSAHDAPTFTAVAALLLAVALTGTAIPALRASRVSPAQVLRGS